MKKMFVLTVIIILSLFNITSAAEYTRIVGKVVNIDLKSSTIKVKVYSKVCNGMRLFSIENDSALENIKPSSEIGLYVIKNCDKALIEEEK